MNKPTISYGDDLKELVADGNYIGRDDQRFPCPGVAYVEWEGVPPERSSARFSFSCHECGNSTIYEQPPEFAGLWGPHVTCPSCGVMIEIRCFRAWESGFRPGLFVIAMPGTRTRWAEVYPIKLRILEFRTSESE
jgi:predicted RNA-binding Zn-ribbon protein involved in translation (DUF1610 family)